MNPLTRPQLLAIAAELRAAEAGMSGAIANLTSRANWNGSDRDSFEREWHDLVRTRLLSAAIRLESVVFVPLP